MKGKGECTTAPPPCILPACSQQKGLQAALGAVAAPISMQNADFSTLSAFFQDLPHRGGVLTSPTLQSCLSFPSPAVAHRGKHSHAPAHRGGSRWMPAARLDSSSCPGAGGRTPSCLQENSAAGGCVCSAATVVSVPPVQQSA